MIPPGTWNVSGTVTLPGGARGLIMQGTIRYTGTAPTSVLVLGDGGTIRNAEKLYTGLNVIRQTISDWSSEADIGITVRNVDASQIELRRVEGFNRCGNAVISRGVKNRSRTSPTWFST